MPVCTTCSREIPAATPFCAWCGSPNPETTPAEDVTVLTDGEALRRRLQTALGPDFTVEGQLGEGGFAIVFAVFERKLSRRIAVKVLRPELVASPSSRARFVREAEASARLSHPHILPIFFVGEGPGLVYFGMPLVEGETLEARIRRVGQEREEVAARIGAEVADALAEAHRVGLVHRDIKPLNVMLQGPKGRVLVADFGIAKAAAGSGEKLTGTGVAIGSPHYMSPEQAAGAEKLDARSDIYSLGILLWQMLAGELPFGAAMSQAVLLQQMTQAVPRLRTRRPDISPALEAVVARCTEKRPEDRYQTADEVAQALRTPGAEAPEAPRRRRRLALAVTVVLLVLLAIPGLTTSYQAFWRGIVGYVTGSGGRPVSSSAQPAGTDSAPAAPASPAPTIAVLPFTVVGAADTAQFARATALMFSEALAIRNGVTTVDANALLGRWIEQRRRTTAPLDSSAHFAYAQGANQMIVGNYLESGRTFRLTAAMYDTHDAAALWRGEVTGPVDSLFSLLDRLAMQAAAALCGQPAYNPANLCYDAAPRPARPVTVAADSARGPLRFLARVSTQGAVTDTRIETPADDPELTSRALSAVTAQSFVPARKRGRAVDAWTSVDVAVEPVAATGVTLAGDCTDPGVGVRNAGRLCYDNRPVPAGRLPLAPSPAACRRAPLPATIRVLVSDRGTVIGAPSVTTASDCAAFTDSALALAAAMNFTPAIKDGRPVAAWTLLLVRPAPTATGGTE